MMLVTDNPRQAPKWGWLIALLVIAALVGIALLANHLLGDGLPHVRKFTP